MDFFAVIDSQRAIRRFRSEPVPDSVIVRILAAASRAPSARGAEPWWFVVVRDPQRRAAISERYRRAWETGQDMTMRADADRDISTSPHYARMMQAAAHLASD